MKIAHFRTSTTAPADHPEALDALLSHIPGVEGVVSVRSMGLTTVLYDERRTDPIEISGQLPSRAYAT